MGVAFPAKDASLHLTLVKWASREAHFPGAVTGLSLLPMTVVGVGRGELEGAGGWRGGEDGGQGLPALFSLLLSHASLHLHSSNQLNRELGYLVCLGNQGPLGNVEAPTHPSTPSEPFLSHGFLLREQQGHVRWWWVNCSEMGRGTDCWSHLCADSEVAGAPSWLLARMMAFQSPWRR